MTGAAPRGAPRPIAEAFAMLAPELRRARLTLFAIVVLGLAAALAESAGIGMVLVLMSVMFGSGPETGLIDDLPIGDLDQWIPSTLHQPGWAAAALVLLIVLRLLLTTGHGLLTSSFAAHIAHETRDRLFRAFSDMPYQDAQGRSWGELYAIVDEHSHAVPETLDAICNIVQALTVVLIVGALLVATSPILAAIGLAAVIVLHRLMALLQPPIERAGAAQAQAANAMSEYLIRTLQALRTFHMLGLIDRQARQFRKASGRAAKAQLHADTIGLAAEPMGQMVALLAVTAMAVASQILGLGYGTLLLAVGLLYRMQPYASSIEEGRLSIVEQAPSLRLVASIPAPAPRSGEAFAGKLAGPIRFAAVTFGYEARGRPVFERLDLTIPAEGWTLIEGPSGTGKSTLVNLLLGLVEPSSGRIVVGDQPLDRIDRSSWRRSVAVCGQDIELVSGSVRDNLLLGAQRTSEHAVAQAIKLTGLDRIVTDLPQGLDTQLGERGAQLSGGQRQRLSIARAVLRDPSLLILDEATSMLDRPSQAAVFSGLARIMAGRAVIVIGHHLADLPALALRFDLVCGAAAVDDPPVASYG